MSTEEALTQQPPAKKQRVPRTKFTFMLHDPKTFVSLGKYVSTDYRYAALKVASRGIKDIYLRKTNTKIVYVYEGKVVELETPQVVTRGERQITYTKKPTVSFVRKYVYTGDIDEEQEPSNVPDEN